MILLLLDAFLLRVNSFLELLHGFEEIFNNWNQMIKIILLQLELLFKF